MISSNMKDKAAAPGKTVKAKAAAPAKAVTHDRSGKVTFRWRMFMMHHRSTCDMKEIGERWRGMSEEDKDKWIPAPHERDDAM